jgi:hypothetical protein
VCWPGPPLPCADVPDYYDSAGYPCADWADTNFDCVRDAANYSEEDAAALLANCPMSCGVCPPVTDTATLPTFERCCDTAISPEGDASCFDNLFTFDVCCPTKEGAHEM